MDRLDHRPCKACGATLVFIPRPQTGSRLPVEPTWLWVVQDRHADATFSVLLDNGVILSHCRRWGGLEADTATPLYGRILHFTTCPDAGRFSRRGGRNAYRSKES